MLSFAGAVWLGDALRQWDALHQSPQVAVLHSVITVFYLPRVGCGSIDVECAMLVGGGP